MARNCTVCTSPTREDLERFISHGGAVREASEIHGIHESSIRRHLVHASRSLMGEARASAEVGTVELLEELVATLHDIVTVRRTAMITGQGGLALRAASAGRETILSLVGLLGVEQADITDSLKLGEVVSRAVVTATRDDPGVGRAVAAKLRSRGALVAADELDAIALTVSRSKGKAIS